MLDAFSRAVSDANECNIFVPQEELNKLQLLVHKSEVRIEIIKQISGNNSSIVKNAARALFAEQPQLLAPGGGAYTNRKMACCLRDMEIILRYVTYAMLAGDASILDDRCLNGLRETYISLGVSCASVAVSIQKMKEATLKLLLEPQVKEENQDLPLSIIRKMYPKQWITIKVTEFKGGFPSRGQVLFYDSDISRLSNKISELSGDIYTFFTSRINDKPDPQFKGEIYKKNKLFIPMVSSFSPDYLVLVNELSSYFDRAAFSVA
jgi:phycocyanin beta chain